MLRYAPLFFAFALVGCDLAEDAFQPQVIVEGFFVSGEPMTAIRLSETAPIDVRYDFDRFALRGAEAELVLLNVLGLPVQTYPLIEHPDFPGNYVTSLTEPAPRVLPGRRYRFEASLPQRPDLLAAGTTVRAETAVPDTFSVIRPPPDTLRYNILTQGPGIDVTAGRDAARQAFFIFSIEALEPDTYGLTPTIADLAERTDADPNDFINGASPILNEENYDRNADGTLTVRVPWFAVSYFGPNRFTANTLDDALYDFIRSRDAQFNPTTLSPGEIQDVLSNVENGTGVFGSLARVSVESFIAE